MIKMISVAKILLVIRIKTLFIYEIVNVEQIGDDFFWEDIFHPISEMFNFEWIFKLFAS